ncbi:tetratricopeptide repeat protein [Polluticoccus soli]|uniref:tetratricopeptide repeat protein n=1 Tax=Polluticoccus soli TaxID=3034150 RepID=UPI0023E2595E|nr:tetratricopeptide repeat protein [Flavipsychrobacter sp. JY13-12]
MKSLFFKCCLLAVFAHILAACSEKKSANGTDHAIFQQPGLKGITQQIKNDPENASLYFERGSILDNMQEDTLALEDYQKAISLDSSKAEYFSAIGDMLFEHKDISGSLKWIEKALKIDPKDPASHLKMAKLFIYTKDYKSAFSEINTVLKQDVYNSEGYFLKGMAYKDMKDTANARSSFETAVQVAPDYKDAIVQLGLLYSAKKDSIALRYFDNAYRVDTTDLFPIYARGVFYQDSKQYEKAKNEYKRVIFRDNQYADAYYNMGYVLMQQDSVDKAWRQYDLLTKIDPTDPEAYYNRGLCSEMMGKKQEAISDYRQALTFYKDYPEAQAGLKRLQGN